MSTGDVSVSSLAKEMALAAMDEGQKIGFDTSISFCEKLSAAYAMRGDQAATTAAQECANGLKRLRDQCNR